MNRVNKIIVHKTYQSELKRIEMLEKDRIYCRHTMEHFLDTARIAYILVLEHHLMIEKEIVYATALLHDIGRAKEYEDKIPHDKASAMIAEGILKDCGFIEEEIAYITETILFHRKKKESDSFFELFYQADKLSRNCSRCAACETCYWPKEQKNHTITY